jgi:hypothetical protein
LLVLLPRNVPFQLQRRGILEFQFLEVVFRRGPLFLRPILNCNKGNVPGKVVVRPELRGGHRGFHWAGHMSEDATSFRDMTHEFAHESGDERLVFWASSEIP